MFSVFETGEKWQLYRQSVLLTVGYNNGSYFSYYDFVHNFTFRIHTRCCLPLFSSYRSDYCAERHVQEYTIKTKQVVYLAHSVVAI